MSSAAGVSRPTITIARKRGEFLMDYAELTRTFTLADVQAYAVLNGDHNPLHLDETFAATTRFGARIVHGMLPAGLFGTVFAAAYPGSIYVAQSFAFRAPVFIGDDVLARCTVTRTWPAGRSGGGSGGVGRVVRCSTQLFAKRDVDARPAHDKGRDERPAILCVDGHADVLVPPPNPDDT